MSKIFSEIYQIVKKIPKRKVATYGQVAELVNGEWLIVNGKKIDCRVVGWALHANKSLDIPCHRVAKNYAFEGVMEQKHRLEAEGATFLSATQVDLEKCLWVF